MTYQEKLRTAYEALRELLTKDAHLDLVNGPYIYEAVASVSDDGSEQYYLTRDLFDAFF